MLCGLFHPRSGRGESRGCIYAFAETEVEIGIPGGERHASVALPGADHFHGDTRLRTDATIIHSEKIAFKIAFPRAPQVAQHLNIFGEILEFYSFWDHNLESFTLMAGLAAVTSRIQIYATAATLTLPPAIVARMAATIDSISGGRFGVNLVTGWQKPEYEQMGIWPGDDYFSRRYDYLTEYVQVLRDLWGSGKSDFKGDFFTMDDCRVSPQPSVPMKVICAGQSDAGMAFSARYADFNFCFGKGVNTPTAFAPTAARMKQAAEQTGRDVGSYVLFMVE